MENKEMKVVVEVVAKDFRNGEVFNVAQAQAKLKTVFGGRDAVKDEQQITFRMSDCNTAKIDVDYHSAVIAEGAAETIVDIDIKGKGFDPVKGQLVDGMAASGKIVKQDPGAGKDKVVEDWFSVSAVKDCGEGCADANSFYSTKTSDVK